MLQVDELELLTKASKALRDGSEGPSEEPEAYLQAIVERTDALRESVVTRLLQNLTIWFEHEALAKARSPRAIALSQDQIDELTELILAHFRTVVRPQVALGKWATFNEMEQKWIQAGLIAPGVRLSSHLKDAFMAGRLFDVISSSTAYPKMLSMARSLPSNQAAEWALLVAEREAAYYFLTPIATIGQQVSASIQRANTEALRDIISRYVAGTLRDSAPNRTGLEPALVPEVGGSVVGWRALARELRNRFRGADFGRDWHRVAATEIRYAYETGRLIEFRTRKVDFVSVLVQEDGCAYCKDLFQDTNGTPLKFAIEKYIEWIEQSPLNVGRKASRIGQADGWLPVVPAHPWCRCTLYPSGHLEQILKVTT